MTYFPPAPNLFALTGLLVLLTACGPDLPSEINVVGTGQASLGGVLVQGERQVAVAGSRVQLYRTGDHTRAVGQTRTDDAGQFVFPTIPAGTYDLAFSANGYAASELLGALARETVPLNYPATLLPLRDRSAAFRLQDPARPPGASNPVVAYSVFSDPVASGPAACPAAPLVPAQIGTGQIGTGQIGTGGPCIEGGPSLEFTTGAAP